LEKPERIMILGIGNLLLGDEGIGVHAAENLQDFPFPDNFEVVEGGTDGFKLFHLVMEADRLIVVDCVRGGDEPGSVYRFDITDVDHPPDLFRTSVHQIGITEVVSLTGTMRTPPRTTIIGVEPGDISMSMELSGRVQVALPRVLGIVLETAGFDPEEYREYLNRPMVQPGPKYTDGPPVMETGIQGDVES